MSKFTDEQRQRAAEHGVSVSLLNNRVNTGWEIEAAITTAPGQRQKVNGDRSSSWSATTGWIMCPVPDCWHKGNIITKAHCRMAHGMEREVVKSKYGMPIKLVNKK